MSKRSNLSYDDGMMIWKTQDAYSGADGPVAVFYLPQFLLTSWRISHIRGRWAGRGFWRSCAVGRAVGRVDGLRAHR